MNPRRLQWLGIGVSFFVTQVVYLLTLTISCPFWDSGEFIATSYILGIPHPPGTPLYVLIGRIFSMIPIFPLVATRVNWLSALASSLTAVFAYLVVVEVHRHWRGVSSASPAAARATGPHASAAAGVTTGDWTAFFGGLVAAFFTAFGRTFWDNAIEAEVYALSSLIMALAVWMALKWARTSGDHGRRNGWFLLLYYILCLSMGIHLGTFLVLPGVVLFMLLTDRRSFAQGRVAALFVAGLVILLHPGMLPTLGLGVYGTVAGVVVLSALLSALGLVTWSAVGVRGILTWCLLASLLGISTHFFLMIRAGQNPPINEANPDTWDALWKTLTRDQYKPANPFAERQAPYSVQLTRHFWDYLKDQYSLGLRPMWLGWLVPYAIGLAGAVVHALREKKTFFMLLAIYLVTSIGMVFYLNFKTEEVRPRDYFFVASFQFFALWIGLGASWLLERYAVLVAAEGARREPVVTAPASRLVVAAGVLVALLPGLTVKHFWFEHDRTNFYLARDYAYNMLKPLKPNAVLFTNGDNDTFPLWYLQCVEKVRPDVRVANLSLLNTDWYIRQLRDEEPKVDFGWTDTEISKLHARMKKDAAGREYVEWVKDVAARRIVEREWGKRPLYLAVTVPDAMGLENRLVMQGLVFEIEEEKPGGERIDAAETLHNLENVYVYRGLLDSDRKYDATVYKDENARRLTQNYAAAWLRAAEDLMAIGKDAEAMKAVESAGEVAPHSQNVQYSLALLLTRVGRFDDAETRIRGLIDGGATDPRLWKLLGRCYEAQGRDSDAEAAYRECFRRFPESFEAMRELFSYFWDVKGQPREGIEVLDDWVRQNPTDPITGDVRALRQEYAESLAIGRFPGGARPAPVDAEINPVDLPATRANRN